MRFFMAAAALLALPVTAANTPTRHLVPGLDEAGLARACETGLAAARKAIKAMEKRGAPGAIFDEWNRLAIGIEDVSGPVTLLVSVHPDKAVRDAGEGCLKELATLNTDLFQNERVFRRVNAANPSNEHQAKLKKDLIAGFEDSGVALPPRSRERAKEIFDRLAELEQAFARNIRDDPTRVIVKPGEMEGLPETYLKAHASSRDRDGNYVLTLKPPSYSPFLRNAKSEAARQRYYIARQNRGGKPNVDILYDIFKLRQELAGLHGLPSFASYSLRRKMAGTPETVLKFLADVKEAVANLENKEIEELREAKAKDTARPPGETRLERWDVDYYQEKMRRERFAIDQETLRKYFVTDKAVAFALLVAQRLYGVRFREAKVPAWHPDVRYFDVLDAKSGRFVSGIYLDLFPREGKYGGGVAFPIRGASRIAHRTPLCALVANLGRDGLNHSQLVVLMHEFGHVLHCALSTVDYNPQAGLNVKIDFVEAPSRMFEEWARRAQPLELFKQVCPDCPHLTHDEVERLEAAQRHGQGIGYAREWLLSAYDMALSTRPQPPLDLWKSLEAATPLGHVEGTMFPASFGHIAGGMAAGYYGYLWSDALGLEMLAPFRPDMLDPKVGERFRRSVLSQGGQEEEIDLVRGFLGREPSTGRFLAEMAGRH
jgi:thimet oligopeptidase